MKAILKKTVFAAVAVLSLGFVGCNNDEHGENYNIKPGNNLYSPATGIELDLSKGGNTVFEWAPSVAENGGFVSYEILFDKTTGDFSAPIGVIVSQLTGSKPSATVSAKDLNNVARAAGVSIGEAGTLKWTIRASKGLFGSIYSEVNTLTIKTMNSMDPLPKVVTLKGEAMEDAAGMPMMASPGIDNTPSTVGIFECFTKVSEGNFNVVDELDRHYIFQADGSLKFSETEVSSSMPGGAGIYWIKADFDGMVWSAEKVSKVELYAAAWFDGMHTARTEMTYTGKGVWQLLNYDNKNSTFGNDSRHRIDMALGNGTTIYLGNSGRPLGATYTTDYLKVAIFSKTGVGNVDWDKTWNFLTPDCGRPLDCYLYMNSDNPAGTWWHKYVFK